MPPGDLIEDLQQIISIVEQGCALRKNTREPMVSAYIVNLWNPGCPVYMISVQEHSFAVFK